MAATAWDRKRAAHLYRRAGFGGTPEELDLAVSLGREGAVSYLVDYDGISTADLDAYLDLFGFDLDGYRTGSATSRAPSCPLVVSRGCSTGPGRSRKR